MIISFPAALSLTGPRQGLDLRQISFTSNAKEPSMSDNHLMGLMRHASIGFAHLESELELVAIGHALATLLFFIIEKPSQLNSLGISCTGAHTPCMVVRELNNIEKAYVKG